MSPREVSKRPKEIDLTELVDENTWVISDTHFGHDNVLKFEPCRVEAMKVNGFRDQNEWLIHNWNSTVGENDLVLHLGDFIFKNKNEEVLYRLNGRIVMIIGNHDFRYLERFKKYQKRFPETFLLVESVAGLTQPEGVSGLIKEINGKKVMFTHYPMVSVDPYTRGKALESRDAMAAVFKQENCDISVHGHLHSKDDFTDKRREINVSLERINFEPVRLGDLIK